MRYFIITGASRGIGEAIARKLLVSGNSLFCTSRTLNEDLVETASGNGIALYFHEFDISKATAAMAFLKQVFQKIDLNAAESIALINNAGVLEPIGPSGTLKSIAIERHYKTNLLAPAILINAFIKYTRKAAIPKVILNISSGASEYPYHGWSAYCSSKAGIDMLTRTIALEQESEKQPVKIFALKPGIVETDMQSLIRQTNPKHFREKDKFVKLYNEGLLTKPVDVAEAIADALFAEKIPQGGILTMAQLKEMK